MKKITALLIALLMSVAVFAACNDTEDDQSKTETVNSNVTSTVTDNSDGTPDASNEPDDPYTDERGVYIVTHDKTKYTGSTFTIIVKGASLGSGSIYQSDDFVVGSEFYGDTLTLAVEKRNQIIEEQYGIELEVIKDTKINEMISLDFNSGTQLYDAVMPTIPQLAYHAQKGFLYDLNDLDSIDVNAPWYDQNANAAFSIGHQLFFTTGDITILQKVCTPSILFNKDYAEALNLPDLYQIVRDGEWTYDKMMEFAKLATRESDGETGMTGADNWGCLNSYSDVWTYFTGFGYDICAKDADDYPYFALTSESAINALQKVLTDMSEKGTWCCYAQNFDGDIWVTSLEAFKQGRVLFRPSAFSAATKLRIAGTNFGILPIPLQNEDQDHYWAFCSAGEAAGIGIPLNAKDPEFSAFMIEAYSCEAKNYLTPAYVEVNLKSKDAKEQDDLDMLDIIFNNIRYDIGNVYNFGEIRGAVTNMVQAGDTNIVSKLDSLIDKINQEIEDIIEQYK